MHGDYFGSLAGSVGAPLVIANSASQALVDGLSGLSGSSNAIQQLFRDRGYSGNRQMAARENLMQKMNDYVLQWQKLEGLGGAGKLVQGRAKINAKIGIVNALINGCSTVPYELTQPSSELQNIIEEVSRKQETTPAQGGGNSPAER